MRAIVTTNTIDYGSNWLKTEDVASLLNIKGSIEVLVFNDSRESDTEVLNYLLKFSQRYKSCKIIYVRDPDRTVKKIEVLVTGGCKGYYIEDEFYISDSNELDNLINDLAVIYEDSGLVNQEVLEGFIKKVKDKNVLPKEYLAVIGKATTDIADAYTKKNLALRQTAEVGAELFKETSSVVESMQRETKNLQKKVEELQKNINGNIAVATANDSGRSPISSSNQLLNLYPSILTIINKKVIRIKELDRCRYSLSFFLGLRTYLSDKVYQSTKLIVLEHATNRIAEEKYSNMAWVNTETKNNRQAWQLKDVVFVNVVVLDVIKCLISEDTVHQYFIVLDRTNTRKEHLINSAGSVLYGVNSYSTLKNLSFEGKDFFTSVEPIQLPRKSVIADKCKFVIPHFDNYPSDANSRVGMYLNECSDMYEKIIMGIK